jgi:hypothetical protein
MCELVGVDDRADAPDLTHRDIERQHHDQALVSVENERSCAAVNVDRAPEQPGTRSRVVGGT